MEEHIYRQMRLVEDRHWWFRGRRKILQAVLNALELPANAAILDVGCGTGGNLEVLSRFGTVHAVEINDGARMQASARRIGTVVPGALPNQLPFAEPSFDVIVMLDVLEHIEDDVAALQALEQLLRPGGIIVVTVPAFRFLWGPHDEVHHHFRRYSQSRLNAVAEHAGLKVNYCSYCNMWLFPAIGIAKLLQRLAPLPGGTGLDLPATPLNRLLETIFSSERLLIPQRRLPFGVSLLAVLAADGPA